MGSGSGFGVWNERTNEKGAVVGEGLRFTVQGLQLLVYGLGFTVRGLRFGVRERECYRTNEEGAVVSEDSECRIRHVRFRM